MLMKQAYNPFLPLHEYVPDGEPHVFGGRLYVYGSHDKEGGDRFCQMGDYVGWSAPVDDLADWRYEGVIYEAAQDPDYRDQTDLYAPDVVRGNDGRYYLYYTPSGPGSGNGFRNPIKVAVCDTPAGRYEYLGHVRNPDGSPFLRYITGDPGLINDDGVIRLYYGWSLSLHLEDAGEGAEAAAKQGGPRRPEDVSPERLLEIEMMLFGRTQEELEAEEHDIMGANHVVLADDMLTVVGEPVRIVPGQFAAAGTSFEGHAFYEAASMRKIGDTYYFIYSSQNQHELVYATSKHPDRDFVYGGAIVSNGDIGIDGRQQADRTNMTGTNHGSIVEVNGEWYVFYHRMTHNGGYSRQACAERIAILPDGTIPQVEVTSCGLNGGPLRGIGTYPAPIAASITDGRMPKLANGVSTDPRPHVSHEIAGHGTDRFISTMTNGSMAEYRYLDFEQYAPTTLTLVARGSAGVIEVLVAGAAVAQIALTESGEWQEYPVAFAASGVAPLAFRYRGDGAADLLSFTLA